MKYTICLGSISKETLTAKSPSIKRPTFASPLLRIRFEDPRDHSRVMQIMSALNKLYKDINHIYHENCNDGSLEIIFYLTYFLKTEKSNGIFSFLQSGKDWFTPIPLAYTFTILSFLYRFLSDLIEDESLDKIIQAIIRDSMQHFAANRQYYDTQAIDFTDYDKEVKMLLGKKAGQILNYLKGTHPGNNFFYLFQFDLRDKISKFFPLVPSDLPKSHFLNAPTFKQQRMMGLILGILNYSISKKESWTTIGNLIAVDDKELEIIKTLKKLAFRQILKFRLIHYQNPITACVINSVTGKREHKPCSNRHFVMITNIDEGKLNRYFLNFTESPNNCPEVACVNFAPLEKPEAIWCFSAVRFDDNDVEKHEVERIAEQLQDLKQILEDLLELDPEEDRPVILGEGLSLRLESHERLLSRPEYKETFDILEVVIKLYDAYKTDQPYKLGIK